MLLYELIITDTECCYDEYSEDFDIGIFESEAQAREIAEYYLNNIAGFCQYPCTYRIVPKEVLGQVQSNEVWLVSGWDLNEELDEIHIVESECLVSRDQAEAVLSDMKKRHQRDEWVINHQPIGKCYWEEGFDRYTYSIPDRPELPSE
ncbi:MAG: hypothetical protein IKE30_00610 [Clostridia bacterium]|nr:hypothetical protein [Clostridia bacterium]